MRLSYSTLALAALVAWAWPPAAAAQDYTVCPTTQAECLVDWDLNGDFVPENNALRNAIANDTDRPADRVYVLRRGGLYYNEDRIANAGFDLRLVGQTRDEADIIDLDCPPGETNPDNCDDFGPAVLQRVTRGDGSIDGVMIESSGDGNGGQVLKNVWLQGQGDQGALANYEPIVINSSNSYFEYDGVVFDRNDWHHLGFKAGGNDIYVRNSLFRNLSDSNPTQRYAGRAIRLEAGADTVAFENNSFFNLTSFPFQSEAAPVEYFVFNHNTLVNFGLTFNAGGIWKRAYIANNIMVNPFWQGESEDQYTAPDRADPFTGVFQIAQLPGRFGLEQDRRIVFANNNLYRQPEIESFYGTLDPVVRSQPIISDTTRGFFEADPEHRVFQNNTQLEPGLTTAPTDAATIAQMQEFIADAATPGAAQPWAVVYWDPGRSDNPLAINFPPPEDFTYSNTALLSAGTDGLPLGDLNWYPEAKEDYLANREDYITEIENLAGGGPREVAEVLQAEAEAGTVAGGAAVQTVAGTTDINLQNGTVSWSFDLGNTSDVTVGVRTVVSLGPSQDARGTRVFLDGVQLNTQNLYGETMYCREDFVAYDGTTDCAALSGGFPLPQDGSFAAAEFNSSNVVVFDGQNPDGAGALVLGPGTHTLRIAAGWGGDFFIRDVEITDDAGATLETLSTVEALATGTTLVCDEEVFCASGFQSVLLPAGGSTEVSITIPSGIGSAIPRLVYRSASGATGEIYVDGTKAGDLSFDATTDIATREAVAPEVTLGEGTHTVRIVSTSGDVELDYVLFNLYDGGGTAVEELPEGWALGTSFPNPTAGTATIRFALAESADVRLDVFDVLGRRVSTLADGLMSAGDHEVRLDARGLASGTYVYRLSTPVGIQARRLTIVR
ncbi:T9SS type A sorting domain-containing protein [Rubrivirga marina]|uniref:Secretion system C-terminal sorting domain-containing protein n=1 Tax=Rubrivirga marina TaxID=1196024 RepID=A0A271IXS4_9BACT|nr:T9SS type A sorting domain-containing protein [Rubrivirga marina]PAP76002.1 hypothetical protein BSZ37_05875 [Rubrivirga marina]